jgi:hypothetical protein
VYYKGREEKSWKEVMHQERKGEEERKKKRRNE